MASNTTLNTGAGGDIIATKERTHDGDATKVQVVTLAGVSGTEGSYTFADINGDATNGLDVDVTRSALPTGASTSANQSTIIGHLDGVEGLLTTIDADTGALAGCVAGTEMQVDIVAGGITGRAEDSAHSTGHEGVVILAVRRDSAASGVDTDGDYATLSVDSSGNLRTTGSSGVTSYTEDAASAGAESLVLMGAVRRDTAASSSGTDGDYSTLNTDANGRLHVIAALAASQTLATVTTVSTVTNVATIGTSVTPGTAAANLGKAEDAAHTTGDVGVMSLGVRTDTAAASSGTTGDYEPFHTDSVGAIWTRSTGELADDSAFTPGTSRVMPMGLQADETSTDSIDEGDIGAPRMSLDRKQYVIAHQETSAIYQNGTSRTPTNLVIDHATSGDNTLLAAQGAGNKIRVHQLMLVSAGTVTVRFESGAGGTALTGQMNLVANTGFVLPFSPTGWFETAANTLLNLELSAAVSVDGVLQYTVVT